MMMIEDREVIFFTQGDDYVAPLLFEGGADGSGSSSGLPAVVGAYKVRNVVLYCNAQGKLYLVRVYRVRTDTKCNGGIWCETKRGEERFGYLGVTNIGRTFLAHQ